MNVFNRVTLEGLKKNKTRTLVTIIGVILSTALLSGVTTFISSLQNYLLESTKKLEGNWHVKFEHIGSDVLKDIKNDSRVESYSLRKVSGVSILRGGQNKQKPYLIINEFSKELYNNLNVELITGNLPKNENELIISQEILINGKGDYKIGDEITLDIGVRGYEGGYIFPLSSYMDGEKYLSLGNKRIYKIVGIFKKPEFVESWSAGYTVITELNNEFNKSDFDDLYVYVNLKKVSNVYKFTEDIEKKYSTNIDGNNYSTPYEYNDKMLRAYGVSRDDSFNRTLYGFCTVLIIIIMVGSILLIYNSFSISVSERTKQFGILSSVGATKKQLLHSVIFEGLFIGIIGVPIGIISGIAGIWVAKLFLGHRFLEMSSVSVPITVHVSLISIIIAVLLGFITILISAYIPARKASKLSTIDAIRQTSDIKIKGKKIKTSKLTEKIYGLEGMLAHKNFKRNKKRYRSTVISLFVSIVLFIGSNSYGMYMKQGIDTSIRNSSYDISYSPMGGMSIKDAEDLLLELSKVDGVTNSTWFKNIIVDGEIPKDRLTDKYISNFAKSKYNGFIENYPISLILVDDNTFQKYVKKNNLNLEDYINVNSPKFLGVAEIDDYDINSNKYGKFNMLKNNKPLEVKLNNGESETHNIVVTNFLSSFPKGIGTSSSNLNVIIPYSMMNIVMEYDDETQGGIDFTFFSNNIKKSVEEMKNILSLNNYESERLYNTQEKEKRDYNLLFIINIFSYGFVIIISLITIANVFNTISTNINLRRREFAMLKSVGMTDSSLNKMMNFECLFYGVKSLLIGLPISMLINYFLYKLIAAGREMTYTIPWLSVGISIFSVFLVVFITMLYSINKIKKENVIDELRNDII